MGNDTDCSGPKLRASRSAPHDQDNDEDDENDNEDSTTDIHDAHPARSAGRSNLIDAKKKEMANPFPFP
jgi:hypothetical protein